MVLGSCLDTAWLKHNRGYCLNGARILLKHNDGYCLNGARILSRHGMTETQ